VGGLFNLFVFAVAFPSLHRSIQLDSSEDVLRAY
jgi:hypothetical protein